MFSSGENRDILGSMSVFTREWVSPGGSKTQVTGHCFTDTVTTLTPFLMLTLGLSATLRQCFRPKHYTKTSFRLKISISKGLGNKK